MRVITGVLCCAVLSVLFLLLEQSRVIAAAASPVTSISDMEMPNGLFPFLTNRNLPVVQRTSNWLPSVSQEKLEKNKELVLRFHKGDRTVLADDFINHDQGNPSTRAAWVEFMKHRTETNKPPPTVGGKPGYGDTAHDAAGKPIISMIAEGDIVIVLRQRDWDWPDGPQPIFKGVFADIWRVKGGKLAEWWCTCTPEDEAPDLIKRAKEGGYWK